MSLLTILNIILAFAVFGTNGYLWAGEPRRPVRFLLVLSEVVGVAGLSLNVVAIYPRMTERSFTHAAYVVAFVLCGLLAACTSYAAYFRRRKAYK